MSASGNNVSKHLTAEQPEKRENRSFVIII